MALVKLNSKEAARLETLLRVPPDTRALKRVQALLWLNDGESVGTVAERLRVTRQTVYNWGAHFLARTDLPLELRVADAARCGRPRTALEIIDPFLEQVIDTDPRELGYRSTIWTALLLQDHLRIQHQVCVSTKSINRALERLQISWKRPRHTLARRAWYWRQAKGG
jgi:transposase